MYKTDYIHLHRRTGTSSWVAVIESGKRLWYVGRGTYAAVIILPNQKIKKKIKSVFGHFRNQWPDVGHYMKSTHLQTTSHAMHLQLQWQQQLKDIWHTHCPVIQKCYSPLEAWETSPIAYSQETALAWLWGRQTCLTTFLLVSTNNAESAWENRAVASFFTDMHYHTVNSYLNMKLFKRGFYKTDQMFLK